jgi:hypothetical protein
MNEQKASQVLAAIRRAEPNKKRVTFFISIEAKSALAAWCRENGVSESGAVEEMIRSIIPGRHFKRSKRLSP